MEHVQTSSRRVFHESFEFIPEAKIHCMVIIAPLIAPDDYDSYAMQEILMCLSKPRDCESSKMAAKEALITRHSFS